MSGKMTGCVQGMEVMIEGQWYLVNDIRKGGQKVSLKRISEPVQIKRQRQKLGNAVIDPHMPRFNE